MLLGLSKFHDYCEKIAHLPSGAAAIDFETTGLDARRGAKVFLVGLSHAELGEASYFIESLPGERGVLGLLLSNPNILYLAHNAKFEMSFIRHQFNLPMPRKIWDTEVFAKVEDNSHRKYDLQACAERIHETKFVPMLAWLNRNKFKYHEAPREIIVPYVEQDARLSRVLFENQQEVFTSWTNNSVVPCAKLLKLEMKTTQNLFEIEDAGLNVNRDYCQAAIAYESEQIEAAKAEFKFLTGVAFKDSSKMFHQILGQYGIDGAKTEKGNPSFDAEFLTGLQAKLAPESAAAKITAAILRYRDAQKRQGSYWENFLELSPDGRVYPNIKQYGAANGRMSITDPSAQNWPDDEESPNPFPIRRTFHADPDCLIVSMDYSQMELRKMVDEAEDYGMIKAFREGLDFHQQTAVQAAAKRGLAKNGRFAKLYGAGVPRVASTLGVSHDVAERICRAIDESSPQVTKYARDLIKYAEYAPFGFDWLGRRFKFQRGLAYKYPNFRISGGCSEILRYAIDDVQTFLKAEAKGNTKMLVPIHDEMTFNWAKCDLHLIPEAKRLMIAADRSKRHLEMEVNVSVGENFHDLETRNDV